MLLNPPRPAHKLRIESARVGLAWGLPLAAVVHASLALRSCRRAQLARHLRPTPPAACCCDGRAPRRRGVECPSVAAPKVLQVYARRRGRCCAASVLSCVAAWRASCGACAGHGCCCAACSVQITSCPLCRVQVRGSLRIACGLRARVCELRILGRVFTRAGRRSAMARRRCVSFPGASLLASSTGPCCRGGVSRLEW
jgi:hypothetical protein